ncbi:MAG: hypothetical protein WA139_05920 [Candidatus Aenigmatarchaeota archaeon]
MKAVSVILQAVLTLAVIVSVATASLPFAQKTIGISIQSAEMSNVRADFLKCSDKILDTARTGSGNKCILSVTEGRIFVRTDGLYYSLTGNDGVCASQEWSLIELNKQVWQRCSSSADKKIYELRWFYPKNDVILLEGTVSLISVSGTRNFDLYQKGSLFVEFDSPKDLSGKIIELTRFAASENTTVLSINIAG